MELIDIGANLTHESFDSDFDEVINEACDAGVRHIILTGTELESSLKAQQLARTWFPNNPEIDPQTALPTRRDAYFSTTAGFHPHHASGFDTQALAAIESLATEAEVVAIGETGLDYNRNFSPRDAQLRAFEQHLELAKHVQKPLFLHQRDAHGDFLQLLTRHRAGIAGGVVHCFTDTESALRDYLELDMYVGITGWICDERRGLDLQQHVKLIPDDRLLIETDAPYLLPRSLDPKPAGRRNEPKYLREVLRMVAKCREQSELTVAANTTANARRLFAVPQVTGD